MAVSPLESHFNDPISNDANVTIFGTYNARLSPLEGNAFGRIVGGPASFDGGRGAVLSPDLTGDSRTNERQGLGAPSGAIDNGVELFLLLVAVDENYGSVGQPPEVHAAVAVHTEASPPQSVTVVIDSRVARLSEPIRVANAESDPHFNQSAPVVAFGAESLIRASQTTGAVVAENRTPAFVLPTLPPQVAVPMNAPGDTGPSRSPSGLIIVPQPGFDAIQPPNSRLLQSEPNLGRSPSSGTLSSGESEPPSRDSTAASLLTSGNPMEGGVEIVMSAGNRAALLASLPFHMEAVDQALATMMNEIEGLGGELVTWLDDASVPPWVVAATVAAASGLGGRYLWRRRGRRSPQEESEEESSSWLFTRLQSPAGQI